MNFATYTTKALEFITTHFEELEKELEKRKWKSEKSNLFFKVGDVIYTKSDERESFIFLKIKDIGEGNNNIIVDEIAVLGDGNFDWYIDEWRQYDQKQNEYKKVKNPDIYLELENIINEYNKKVDKLNDETYQSLTNLIENEL